MTLLPSVQYHLVLHSMSYSTKLNTMLNCGMIFYLPVEEGQNSANVGTILCFMIFKTMNFLFEITVQTKLLISKIQLVKQSQFNQRLSFNQDTFQVISKVLLVYKQPKQKTYWTRHIVSPKQFPKIQSHVMQLILYTILSIDQQQNTFLVSHA